MVHEQAHLTQPDERTLNVNDLADGGDLDSYVEEPIQHTTVEEELEQESEELGVGAPETETESGDDQEEDETDLPLERGGGQGHGAGGLEHGGIGGYDAAFNTGAVQLAGNTP